jgi:hypothetical protein
VTAPRTLPVRVPPRPGEALDSWLETLAHRLQAALGDVAAALGLATEREPGRCRPGSRGYLTAPDWAIALHGGEARSIAGACQIAPAAARELTLARYDGVALRLDPAFRKVDRNTLWGRASGSRFCPACLRENSGRWQLAWRLSWSFACLQHQCLLADHCPACGRLQRICPRPLTAVPRPGTCASAGQQAIGRAAPRCGADLTRAPVMALARGHPVLTAQRLILEAIQTGTAAFGVYADQPQPAPALLTDLRALAGRVLADVPPGELPGVLPEDIVTEYRRIRSQPHSRAAPSTSRTRPGFLAPARAAVTATAVTTTIQALALPGTRQAGTALHWLFRATGKPRWPSATLTSTSSWSRGTSPVLQAVQLASFSHPAPLRASPAPARTRTRQAPALLWAAWTIRLAPPRRHFRQTHQILANSLSLAFVVMSTHLDLDEAAAQLGSLTSPSDTALLLHRLEHDPRWPAAVTALTRLSEYLDTHRSPINYARRRHLDYNCLLPGEEWREICHHSNTAPGGRGRAVTARRWLFERLSGTPADLAPAPFTIDGPRSRACLAAFATLLTPALLTALDDHGQAFLHKHDIASEPSAWQPPATLLTGLDLPGPDPGQHDISELHQLIRHARLTPRAAAAQLGTTIDTVRYLLETSPAPAQADTP